MSVDNVDYDAKEDETLSATASDAEDGDGGGNMAVWTESRENQIDKLVHGIPYTDSSDFGLPKAASPGSYPQSLSDAEHALNQPSTEAVVGGDGLMDVWDQSRSEQFGLVQSVPNGFTNESEYSLPAGADPGSYPQTLTDAEKTINSPPAGVEKGINVDDSITFEGTVFLAEDQENPNAAAVIAIDDANVYIEAEESEDLSNEITTNDDGSYTLPIPKRTETTKYFATITHEYFDEEFVHETEEGSLSEQRDWYLKLPQFAGVPGRGASFGNPVIG